MNDRITREELTAIESRRIYAGLCRMAGEAFEVSEALTAAHCYTDSEPLVESVKRLIGERDSERERADRLRYVEREIVRVLEERDAARKALLEERKKATVNTVTVHCTTNRPASPVASPAPVAQVAQQPEPGQRIRITHVGPTNGSTLKVGDVITVLEQVVSTPDRGGLTWVQDKLERWHKFGWVRWEPVAMKGGSPYGIPDFSAGNFGKPNEPAIAGQSTESLQAKIRRQRTELRHLNRRLREALLEVEVLKNALRGA